LARGRLTNFKKGRKILTLLSFGCPTYHQGCSRAGTRGTAFPHLFALIRTASQKSTVKQEDPLCKFQCSLYSNYLGKYLFLFGVGTRRRSHTYFFRTTSLLIIYILLLQVEKGFEMHASEIVKLVNYIVSLTIFSYISIKAMKASCSSKHLKRQYLEESRTRLFCAIILESLVKILIWKKSCSFRHFENTCVHSPPSIYADDENSCFQKVPNNTISYKSVAVQMLLLI